MHMHAITHKKDSSDLDTAIAPLQVDEELADKYGSCTAQPYGYSQNNQQETLQDFDAGFWEDLIGSDDQMCESAGPSL